MPKSKKEQTSSIVLSEVMKSARDNDLSVQPSGAHRDFGAITREPLFPNQSFINIVENNNIVKRSIEFYAKNFISAGFDIIPDHNIDFADAKAEERDAIVQWFKDCVDEGTFLGVIKQAKMDQKTCGHSAIEIARNKLSGKPEKIYYMPIDTVRVAKGGKSFKTGQRFVQNEDFGTLQEKDAIWYNKYQPKENYRTYQYGYKKGLNEVLWNKETNSSDPYYGLSPITAIVRDHALGIYSKDYNIAEFEDGMLQKIAILVKNGNITPQSIESIKEFFKTHLKGQEKQKMIPVLNCTGQKAEIDIKQLSKEMKEGSFLQLLDYVDQQGFVALGVPPVLLGIVKDANRSNALEQKQKFIEDEIMPEQREDEVMWTKLIQEDLGFSNWKFVFRAAKIRDTAEANSIATEGVRDGSFSINDKLRHLGREPIRDSQGNLDEGAEMHVVTTAQGVMIPVSELKNLANNWQSQITNQSVETAKENVKKLHKYLESKDQVKEIIKGEDGSKYAMNKEYNQKLSSYGFSINKIKMDE